jgi:hypothetical protein
VGKIEDTVIAGQARNDPQVFGLCKQMVKGHFSTIDSCFFINIQKTPNEILYIYK